MNVGLWGWFQFNSCFQPQLNYSFNSAEFSNLSKDFFQADISLPLVESVRSK